MTLVTRRQRGDLLNDAISFAQILPDLRKFIPHGILYNYSPSLLTNSAPQPQQCLSCRDDISSAFGLIADRWRGL